MKDLRGTALLNALRLIASGESYVPRALVDTGRSDGVAEERHVLDGAREPWVRDSGHAVDLQPDESLGREVAQRWLGLVATMLTVGVWHGLSLNFVACAPDFHLVHKVSSGMTDLLAEVFGRDIGIGCRATIGIQALALNNCFETWMEVEFR